MKSVSTLARLPSRRFSSLPIPMPMLSPTMKSGTRFFCVFASLLYLHFFSPHTSSCSRFRFHVPGDSFFLFARAGKILRWHVREGDRIQQEQIIFDLETDTLTEDGGRTVLEIEAHEEGAMKRFTPRTIVR